MCTAYLPQMMAANTSLQQAVTTWADIDARRPAFNAEVDAIAALAVGTYIESSGLRWLMLQNDMGGRNLVSFDHSLGRYYSLVDLEDGSHETFNSRTFSNSYINWFKIEVQSH